MNYETIITNRSCRVAWQLAREQAGNSLRNTLRTMGKVALLALLFCPSFALAADDAAPPPGESKSKILSTLERTHEIISVQVDELSERIDAFLGGGKTCDYATGSTVQAGGSVVFLKDGTVLFNQALRAKINLPKAKERFKLLLETDPEREIREPLGPGTRSSTETESISQAGSDFTNLSAALQYVMQERRKWQFSLDGGARVRIPPDPFARLRMKRSFNLGEWRFHAVETLFWFESSGAGESTHLDVEKIVFGCHLFRSTTDVVWKEQERKFEASENVFLFQELSEKAVLTYSAGVTGETEPDTHVRDYGLGVEYRRRIHKNWLYLTIAPAVTFSKANNFEFAPSIRFGFDVTFGVDYTH